MVSKSLIRSGHGLIAKLKIEPFTPKSWLNNGWSQTIASQIWPRNVQRTGHDYHLITLSDNDKICVVEMRPNTEIKGVILLVHGINGDYKSHYIQRMAMQANLCGWMVYCLNLRNCGPSLGYSRKIYNAGNSQDILETLRWLKLKHSQLPVFLCGYSLGGNICLKAIGEDSENLIDAGAVVSTPVDLVRSSMRLAQPQNRLFNRSIFRDCVHQLNRMRPYLAQFPLHEFSKSDVLRDFDENITAPMSGYKTADEYYYNASALHSVHRIRIPVLIISSMDDPLVDHEYLKITQQNIHLEHLITEYGGHLGFIQYGKTGIHWLEDVLCAWFQSLKY